MKCLIVSAHPLADSLCNNLAKRVVNHLRESGHEVILEDLYANKFSPTLTSAERQTYYLDSYDSSAIAEQVDRLEQAEALVLLFPTWWFGFPAILKGWFDRVWAPGIAFDNTENFGPIKPRLKNLQKTLVVTTLGSPWWVDRFIMRQPVKRIVKVALLSTCASNCKLQFLSLYTSENLTTKRIQNFEQKIESELRKWNR